MQLDDSLTKIDCPLGKKSSRFLEVRAFLKVDYVTLIVLALVPFGIDKWPSRISDLLFMIRHIICTTFPELASCTNFLCLLEGCLCIANGFSVLERNITMCLCLASASFY